MGEDSGDPFDLFHGVCLPIHPVFGWIRSFSGSIGGIPWVDLLGDFSDWVRFDFGLLTHQLGRVFAAACLFDDSCFFFFLFLVRFRVFIGVV